jgi:D-alanyl-D-alanine carboxypeptidase
MNKRKVAILAAAILILSVLNPQSARAAEDLTARIDALLAKTYPADKPGAVALVVQDGRILLRKAYGMADVELGVPVVPESVFPCGSVTKMFTATAIMQLAEEGKLGYEDPISKYFPDAPAAWAGLKIDHLLSHTSGILDLFQIPGWMAQWKEEITPDGLIAFFKDKPLQFEPGTKAVYCNSNYVLLGRIVERITSQPLDRWVKERIIDRLGLKKTWFAVSHEEIIPGRLDGYLLYPDGGFKNMPFLIPWSQAFGAGTVHSTVDEMAKFVEGLFDGTLLKPSSLAKVTVPRTLPDGTRSPYGYGNLFVFLEGIPPLVRISGSTSTTEVMTLYAPEQNTFVAVFSNVSTYFPDVKNPYHPSAAARDIALLLLKK